MALAHANDYFNQAALCHMRKCICINGIFGAGFFLCLGASEVSPSLLLPIGTVVCLLVLVIQAIVCFTIGLSSWRKISRWWFIPLLVSIGFIALAPLILRLGLICANREFRHNLPQYTTIIEDVKSGKIPCNESFEVILPNSVPSEVKQIMALREKDGTVIVIFLVGS